jgi:CheY-like chemotaxis protein
MATPASARETSNGGKSAAPNKRILVVDDDPVSVKALSLKLTSQGFSVVTASDGSEAISVSRQGKPDLMLVDIHFPPDVAHGGGVLWNGFLITQWLQRLEATKNTPVILISAKDRPEYKHRASAVGAVAFLPKPIDHHALVTSIETALIRRTGIAPVKTMDAANQKPDDNSRNPGLPASSKDELPQSSALDFGL